MTEAPLRCVTLGTYFFKLLSHPILPAYSYLLFWVQTEYFSFHLWDRTGSICLSVSGIFHLTWWSSSSIHFEAVALFSPRLASLITFKDALSKSSRLLVPSLFHFTLTADPFSIHRFSDLGKLPPWGIIFHSSTTEHVCPRNDAMCFGYINLKGPALFSRYSQSVCRL